jgi:hypothetical protein
MLNQPRPPNRRPLRWTDDLAPTTGSRPTLQTTTLGNAAFSVFGDEHLRKQDLRQVAAPIVLAQSCSGGVGDPISDVSGNASRPRFRRRDHHSLCLLVLASLLHSRDLHDLDNLYPRPRHLQVGMILAE